MVHHHAQLRTKYDYLDSNTRLQYQTCAKSAQEQTTNAVGMNCLNSLVKYRNLLQVVEQGRTRGGPSWGVESHPKGRLTMVFDKAEMPYVGPHQGLRHLGVLQAPVRYLAMRSKGANLVGHHGAVAGLYQAPVPPRGGKRKAEESLPEEMQLFSGNTGQKKGKYFLDFRVPMPSDSKSITADQIKEAILGHNRTKNGRGGTRRTAHVA